MINKIKQHIKDFDKLNIIFLTKFGSHLYGTDSESSDIDIKGVFLPTTEQCFLNEIPKSLSYSSGKDDSKNSSDDIDIELYSLHYYLKLLQKGDTGAIDMLHAPMAVIIQTSELWEQLHDDRREFYTTNLSAFVGYCRTQASKYGIKGSRLSDAKKVLDYLEPFKDEENSRKLFEIWDSLPTGEHIHKIPSNPELRIDHPMYQVCGRKLQSTVPIWRAYGCINHFYQEYGKRAKLAAENKGINWKAVSHAIRCAFEMHSIYSQGGLTFPLRQADYIKMVKNGERDYKAVAENLETLMDQVENLAANSKYPKKVDMKKWNDWLIDIYRNHE